jgi:hypothetical protein
MGNWDIIITDWMLTYDQYCLDFDTWSNECIHRMYVYPEQTIDQYTIKSTESYSNTAVFVIVILLLIWLVKWIFRLILPSRWK